MKIAIDATPIGVITRDTGGVHHYIHHLLASLERVAADEEILLFFNFFRSAHLEAFRRVRSLFGDGRFRVVLRRVPNRLWTRLPIPVEFLIGRVDVFHGLYDFVPPVLRGAAVVTIHDLRYLTMEEAFDPAVGRRIESDEDLLRDYRQRLSFFARQRRIIGRVARRADAILTPSEFSRQAILRAFGLPASRVRVVHHGVSPAVAAAPPQGVGEAIRRRLGIDRPYLLFVGKQDPMKNLVRLLEAFREIRREADLQMVVAGPLGWYQPILRRRVADRGMEGAVVFTGYVPDEDLGALYRGAEAFVFPSLFEGFGLPVVEAMACEVPVVCSNVTSLPEIAGDAALQVDPLSAGEIAAAIRRVLSDGPLRARLVERGRERARGFTWDETARNTLAVYQEVGAP